MKTNLETIQGIYEGDAEQIAKNLQSALAPRFEWTEAAGFPYAGTYHSMEEVGKNVFARLATEWDGYRAEVDKFYDAGDTIIVTGRYLGNLQEVRGRDGRRVCAHMEFQGRQNREIHPERGHQKGVGRD